MLYFNYISIKLKKKENKQTKDGEKLVFTQSFLTFDIVKVSSPQPSLLT